MDAAASEQETGGGESPRRVYRLSTAQLVVAPIRVLLGLVLLPVAVAVGPRAPAGVAFAAGAFALFFVALNDPRRRFFAARGEPEPLPAGSVPVPPLELVRMMVYPSTVGVAGLAVVALGLGQGVLAALLAGALAGMGLAAGLTGGMLLERERRRGAALLAEKGVPRLYEQAL